MKILNLIFLTATVATVLLSLSSSGQVDAFGGDCWKNIRSWFSTSCNSNHDCPSNLRCFSGTCIDLCEKYCSSNHCIKLSTNSVQCCEITYSGWLNPRLISVCKTHMFTTNW
ncbi:GSCOCG00004280001-RA-CDS [Cotesia congregata]|uniref:WAP domain-containing protein n=1 Tax=Cotesia congregata TaxID=51543 RepID=A0A8J2HU76_COTCN|nr:GSCOCG00004280001-RA-CDS [Cotesia congregata]CAG5109059.1 Protein of unknown function [Cotesia congregata]